jgi:hypothetical protein
MLNILYVYDLHPTLLWQNYSSMECMYVMPVSGASVAPFGAIHTFHEVKTDKIKLIS